MWQVLQEYLGSKYLALLLDNFEHVLAGAPLPEVSGQSPAVALFVNRTRVVGNAPGIGPFA